MSSVLSELVDATHRRLAGQHPAADPMNVPAATHRFAAALGRRGPSFILEMKRASPSAGPLRVEYDPAFLAAEFAGIADAISVITAPHRFLGSLDHLRQARAHAAAPILCKDFIVDSRQVTDARAAGADAVLLMLSVLDDDEYARCAAAADALGMDVLSEVHDATELERAIALDAAIIGINNRDLRTLAVDLATTERLAPLVPAGRLIVAESGIRSRADIRRLAPLVDAFLVGTTLMRAERPGLAARELIFGRVKICGLTRPADARLAWEAGASYGGVVFADGSPRRVDEPRAAEISRAAPLPLVGVFVDERVETVAAIASALELAAVQLHGRVTREDIAAVRARLPVGCEVWKALAVPERGPMPAIDAFGADRIVLDTAHPTLAGGTGRRFEWSRIDYGDRERIVLAGGIDEACAAEAGALGCGVIDLASGVESRPGVKDPARIDAFFRALCEAA